MPFLNLDGLKYFWEKAQSKVLLRQAQSLTPQEQAQVKQNLGISVGGGNKHQW